MDKPKRNNGTISFSDKSQKEEVQRILREKRLQNLMPDNIRGKDGLMVLWAVRYLRNLADKGKMRYEVPMFEEESEEKRQLLSRISDLERDYNRLSGLVQKMVSMEKGVFEVTKVNENKDMEITLRPAHEVCVWNGIYPTDN